MTTEFIEILGAETGQIVEQIEIVQLGGPRGDPGTGPGMLPMSITGALQVGIGVQPFVATRAMIISRVRAACGTAPTAASIIFDVNRNGMTIFTTQANRPKILAGQTVGGEAIPDQVIVAAGDVLTVDVDQVGSSVPGSNATLVVELI